MTIKNQFGVNPSKRKPIAEDFRLEGIGFNNNNGIDREKFNELIFRSECDHLWGTEAQVKLSSPRATFYTNASGNPLDASDAAVTLNDDDRIIMVHDTALTADLKLVSTSRLNIKTDRGLTLDLGADSGNSNTPFNVVIEDADFSTINIFTNKDFEDVLTAKAAATRAEQSVVKNRTLGSKIFLNNRQIFGRRRLENMLTKSGDPYNILLDGTNDLSQTDYKDLFNEFKFKFTPGINTALSNSTFAIPDTRGRFVRLGGGSSSIAPDQHNRTATVSFTQWPNTSTNISASLTSGSNDITVDATASGTEADNITFLQGLVGMRVETSNDRVPDGGTSPEGTTIISSVDTSTSSAVVIALVDSRTGSDTNSTATATETLTISNSGDVEGSIEEDQLQGHGHRINTRGNIVGTGPQDGVVNNLGTNTIGVTDDDYIVDPVDASNGAVRYGDQTKPISTLRFETYLL